MRVRACANVQIHVKPTAPKFSPIIYAKTLPLKYNNERVIDFYRQGKFDIAGLITHRFPLKDYKEAIRIAFHKGKEKAIEVVFEHT